MRRLILLALALSACNGSNPPPAQVGSPGAPPGAAAAGGRYAVIATNFGDIVVEFHPEVAPKTVENFITLAGKGFYNGLTFHRILRGFMMQGGCPKGDGSGGPGYEIKAEFNAMKHVAGTLSMARTNDPDSAGSQFFICFAPAPMLDGQYTAFAQVVKGMEVVKKVEEEAGTRDEGKPRKLVKMEKVTVTDKLP